MRTAANVLDENRNAQDGKHLIQEVIVIFIFLVFFGFPGSFANVFGQVLDTLANYLSFLLEIVVMLMASGRSIPEIKLFSFQRRYMCMYMFEFVVIILSLLVARYKKEELITCVRLYTLVTYSIWITKKYSIEKMFEMLSKAQLLFLFFTLALTALFPSQAFSSEVNENDFVGLLDTKNEAATVLAFGLLIHLVYLSILRKNKKTFPQYYLLVLPIQAILMLMCRATGAVLSMLMVFSYLFIYKEMFNNESRLPLGFIYVVSSIGFIFVAMTILQLFAPMLEAMGKDATLTGRIPIWTQLISVISEKNTLTGYGYEMFWRDEEAIKLYHVGFDRNSWAAQMVSGSHNVLIELWVNIGLIGLAFYLYMFLEAFRNVNHMNDLQYTFCCCIVLMYDFFGLSERSFNPRGYMTMIVLIAIAIGCNNNERSVKELGGKWSKRRRKKRNRRLKEVS